MHPYEQKTVGQRIRKNPYPGRGIVTGCTPNGKYVASAYFITGRSENSRNRIFVNHGSFLTTEPFDTSKMEDPSLILYTAVRRFANRLVITNGDHTDTVYEALSAGKTLEEALETRTFEPDAPNFTPRIGSVVTLEGQTFSYCMSILKSLDEAGSTCVRYFFRYPAKAGTGHLIHTYQTNGNPLPSFCGEPKRIVLPDDIDAFTQEIWQNLNEQKRIALYVRFESLEDGTVLERLINQNETR